MTLKSTKSTNLKFWLISNPSFSAFLQMENIWHIVKITEDRAEFTHCKEIL